MTFEHYSNNKAFSLELYNRNGLRIRKTVIPYTIEHDPVNNRDIRLEYFGNKISSGCYIDTDLGKFVYLKTRKSSNFSVDSDMKYPQEALRTGTSGSVVYSITINDKGNLTQSSLVNNAPSVLTEAVSTSLDRAKNKDFKVASHQGKKVYSQFLYFVTFEIGLSEITPNYYHNPFPPHMDYMQNIPTPNIQAPKF